MYPCLSPGCNQSKGQDEISSEAQLWKDLLLAGFPGCKMEGLATFWLPAWWPSVPGNLGLSTYQLNSSKPARETVASGTEASILCNIIPDLEGTSLQLCHILLVGSMSCPHSRGEDRAGDCVQEARS